jgi:hypothetical protein
MLDAGAAGFLGKKRGVRGEASRKGIDAAGIGERRSLSKA